MVDLHMHTDMSDGTDRPLELLDKVIATGCNSFSVTDHDDLRSNNIILSAMKEKSCDIKFFTGCEISSVFEGRNLHLLCYGFDPDAGSVKAMIAEGAAFRRQRITAMFEHLKNKHSIVIPEEDKAVILSRDIPGKVHITDAVMKLGIKISRQEFFDNYLDDMESRGYKIKAERVIDLVGKAGGITSFAHPIEVQREYKIDFAELFEMVQKLKAKGLAAIEAYHSLHGKTEIAEYERIATDTGLLISGGSDYHGKNKNVLLGQLNSANYPIGDNKITILDALREIRI